MIRKSEFGKFADDLRKMSDEFQEDIRDYLRADAEALGEEMLDGYKSYVVNNTYVRGVGPNTEGYDYSYLISQTKNGEKISEDKPAYIYVLPHGKDGMFVGLRGDTVAFYEFGTGTHGKINYPDKRILAEHDWVYGAGAKVLQHGKWRNAYADKAVPKWYRTALKHKVVTRSDMVWMYNKYIRRGLPPGAFIYDAIENFESGGGYEDYGVTENVGYNLSDKGIYGYVSARLNGKK